MQVENAWYKIWIFKSLKVYLYMSDLTNKQIRQMIINYNNNIEPSKNTLKVLEESAELSEVLLKMLTKAPNYKPHIDKVIEEAGDLFFRLRIYCQEKGIEEAVKQRYLFKHEQLEKWIVDKYEGVV